MQGCLDLGLRLSVTVQGLATTKHWSELLEEEMGFGLGLPRWC